MSEDDERKAIVKAQGILSTLTPSTPRNDGITHALRDASRLATAAIAKGFSSDAALNNTRGDASIALSAVAGSSDARTLTQDMIATARRAVAALLTGLDQHQ
jgi:hypothetical protein